MGLVIGTPAENDNKGRGKKKKAKDAVAVKITVQQLVDCASHIAAQDPVVNVPQVVATALRQAINARSKCSQWFKRNFTSSADSAISASNSRHEHFVEKLQEMLLILQSNFEKTDKDNTSSASEDGSMPTNTYELLELEEVEEADTLPCLELVEAASSAGQAQRPARRQSKLNTDWLFRAYCAFQDINDIREHVRSLWIRFGEGKLDFLTAAFIADVALEQIQVIEDQSLRPTVNGEPLSPVDVAEELAGIAVALTGEPPFIGPTRLFPVMEWLGIAVWGQMEEFIVIKEERLIRATLDRAYPACSKPRPAMSFWEQFATNGRTVAPLICDTNIAFDLEGMDKLPILSIPSTDILTRHIRAARPKEPSALVRKDSVALLFGLLMNIDCHDVLGAKMQQPAKQMVIKSKLYGRTLSNHSDFLSGQTAQVLARELRQKAIEECMETRRLTYPALQDNRVTLAKSSLRPDWKTLLTHTDLAPFSLNPVLAGLNSLLTQMMDNIAIIKVVDFHWHVMPVAHLYNALLQNGHGDLRWTSMQKLITLFTPEFFFNGGAPTSLKDCHTKIRLAKGLSADQNLPARTARQKNVARVRRKRELRDGLGDVFWGVFDAIHPEFDPLSDHARLDILDRLVRKRTSRKTRDLIRTRGYDEVLEFLESEMPAAMSKLQFDYLSLHEQCLKVQLALVDKYQPVLHMIPHLQGYNKGADEAMYHIAEDVLLLATGDLVYRNKQTILDEVAHIMRSVI